MSATTRTGGGSAPAAPSSRARLRAARIGLRRGLIEFGHLLRSREELIGLFGYGLLPLGALLWFDLQGDDLIVGGTAFPYVRFVTPGMLAVVIAFSMLSPAQRLATEREDGTVLRVRTAPHGLIAYAVGRTTAVSLETVTGVLWTLLPALVLIDGIADVPWTGWLHLSWVVLLGLTATVPIGMLIGCAVRSSRGVFPIGVVVLVVLTGIAGIYTPLTALPGWLQGVAQALPVYWIGLGMRAALLPDPMVAAEIGESWRTGLTVLALGGWSVAGALLAPLALRRAARRESGSALRARRAAAVGR